MKSKNVSQYVVAVVVIACSVTLLAALTIALSGSRWNSGGRKLHIDFQDATGIKLHSSVRYAGAVAGTVIGIRYLKPEERAQPGHRDHAVRVTVRLDNDVPALPSDLEAGLSSETMLGEKFVALSAGSPEASPLADGAVIPGQSLSGVDGLITSFEKTSAAATELLHRVNADFPEIRSNLNQVLLSGDKLINTATNLVNDGRTAVGDVRGTLHQVDLTIEGIRPKANDALSEVAVASTNLNITMENARDITADVHAFLNNQFLANLDENMRTLTNVLARVEIAAEYAKILAGHLAEKPSRLIWQTKANKLPTEEEIRRGVTNPPPKNAKK